MAKRESKETHDPATEWAVSAMAALAHPHRLAVVQRLMCAGPAGEAAGNIAEGLSIAPSSLSFHLNQLETCGLLRASRQGRRILYSVAPEAFERLIDFVIDDCWDLWPERTTRFQRLADHLPLRPRG